MGNSARETFCRKVREHGGSGAVAKSLGCSRSYVDMVMRGVRRPGMRVARAIEERFGIAMRDWLDGEPTRP